VGRASVTGSGRLKFGTSGTPGPELPVGRGQLVPSRVPGRDSAAAATLRGRGPSQLQDWTRHVASISGVLLIAYASSIIVDMVSLSITNG
jgi:hypothetical protein